MRKKAIVTGASRGIGKSIARALASSGYDLILICRNNELLLKELAKELCDEYNIMVNCFVGDVSNPDFVTSIFKEVTKVDVLINNAGISHYGLLEDMTNEEWRNLIGVNLDSVFFFSREAIKCMLKEHSGHIINISSVWGEKGASYEVAYSASKAGVNGLTKALAKELAISGISVNAIACGIIDTDMNKHLNDDELKDITDSIPIDRMGQPEEVADMCLSILSAPSYMTGQIITLDGGWT